MKIYINTEDWDDSFLEHLPNEEIPRDKLMCVLLDLIRQAEYEVKEFSVKENLLEATKAIPHNK